ncbi:hypothetical protein QQP08_027717 [Theobroma cacao]|nr:hypothetical protein QQP08_027717 [Theobroma cacao]
MEVALPNRARQRVKGVGIKNGRCASSHTGIETERNRLTSGSGISLLKSSTSRAAVQSQENY